MLDRIMKAIYSHMETIRKEKPGLAQKIDNYFKEIKVKENLQLGKSKDEDKNTN